MGTIYQTISGQSVRQQQESKHPHRNIIEVRKIEGSNLLEKAKCSGQSNFTSAMWAEDLETLERWIKEWSHYPEKIKIKLV